MPFDNDAMDYALANDGTVSGATLNKTDFKVGSGAYSFDGVNDKIDTGSDIIGTGDDSVCAWIYPKDLGISNLGSIVINDYFLFTLRNYNIGTGLSSNGGTNVAYSAMNAITFNTWQHVCVVRNSTGSTNFYFNGLLSGTANQNSGTPGAGVTNVIIGSRSSNVWEFNGSIDEVAIWNRSLSADEIQQLYYAGIGKDGTELLSNFSKKNDNITVEVTSIDYLDWGTAVNSSLITILDTYATWSNNGTNFTSIRKTDNGMFNVTVNDADELDRCIFSLKNSSSASWYNYSALDVSGSSYELRYNITISSTNGQTLSWRYYCNDSSGQMYNSSINDIMISDTYATWQNNGTNFTSIKVNENGMFNLTINDADGLNSAIFSLKNSSGADWYNYSALRISGTSYELMYNVTISSNSTQVLSWRYYFNDSFGVMYNSSEFNIV